MENSKKHQLPNYYDDLREVIEELESENDRSVAIVGAAFIEAKLEIALKSHLIPNLSNSKLDNLFDGPTAPLSTFSGKTRLAHALGLIGDQSLADLNLIRKIRNEFAHNIKLKSFEESSISRSCSDLHLAEYVFMAEDIPQEPRQRFIRSLVNIMQFIYSETVAGTPIGASPSKSP